MGTLYGVDGDLLERQYRNHLSNYLHWDQPVSYTHLEEIINEHIIGGRRIKRLIYVDPKTEHTVSDSKHMDFYRKQLRIALRNCGFRCV